MSIKTNITVRVMAVGGKFLASDEPNGVKGAFINVTELGQTTSLASGLTQGDSGPNGTNVSGPSGIMVSRGVMCEALKRGEPLPMNLPSGSAQGTAIFQFSLYLSAPLRIQVMATGPQGFPSTVQNTASVTTWVFPGRDITAGNGLLLELPGLICQIKSPTTQTTGTQILAYVAMMCGCPISNKVDNQICPGPSYMQPWPPVDFEVFAVLPAVSTNPIPLTWTWDSKAKLPGQFTAPLPLLKAGSYDITVYAQQISTGNTGVDQATFTV